MSQSWNLNATWVGVMQAAILETGREQVLWSGNEANREDEFTIW